MYIWIFRGGVLFCGPFAAAGKAASLSAGKRKVLRERALKTVAAGENATTNGGHVVNNVLWQTKQRDKDVDARHVHTHTLVMWLGKTARWVYVSESVGVASLCEWNNGKRIRRLARVQRDAERRGEKRLGCARRDKGKIKIKRWSDRYRRKKGIYVYAYTVVRKRREISMKD